ncbi:hypothetical protein [[Leptolyngbya] sp. PCC 7376]|uniref:hypothetical protein n=1 Tax=[Leptolyngbya] sp. PCC 7376 TaxID=111781 RepID=UPI0013574D2A|nr:hypothetical protein [[Leptolyngbya] sp. PCC 7376]
MERLEAMKNSIESFTFSLTSIFQTTSRKESTNGIQVMTRIPGALRTSIWDAEMTDADLDSIILTQINVAETILQIVRLLAGTNIEDITVTSSAGVL